jgi:hypothetical protein
MKGRISLIQNELAQSFQKIPIGKEIKNRINYFF